MATDPLFLSNEGLVFETLSTYEQRFEYAQYIVNTRPEDRTEITPEDAEAALAWYATQV